MEREILIKKWLDSSLNTEEQKAFDALDDSADLKRLSTSMVHFKAPLFKPETILKNVKLAKTTTKKSIPLYKQLLPIAALIVLALGVTYFFSANSTLITKTTASEMATLVLPDATGVTLNATSSLQFDEASWNTNRITKLEGEAYFNVTKGSKFTVETSQGTVTVLGTQFNVKQRDGFFEVHCYEGSVKVDHNLKTVILSPGDYISIHSNKVNTGTNLTLKKATWISGKSTFKSVPYQEVLDEIERQFAVTITTQYDTKKPLFTGTFNNDNLDEALKTITMPLNLNYSISTKNVIIINE